MMNTTRRSSIPRSLHAATFAGCKGFYGGDDTIRVSVIDGFGHRLRIVCETRLCVMSGHCLGEVCQQLEREFGTDDAPAFCDAWNIGLDRSKVGAA